jgi:microcystin-dependent protein
MPEPYIGEIRLFGGSFAPVGWALCDGTPVPIAENDALYVVIGTRYGGDGQETFNLPNLQGRVPMHMGQGPGISHNYQIGEMAGVESVTLTTQQIPIHNHAMVASTAVGNSISPADNVTGLSAQVKFYNLGTAVSPMNASAVQPVGGSQPHENMQPYLVITFIISLYGVFPDPN